MKPGSRLVLFVVMAASCSLVGCGGGGAEDNLPRQAISGNVTLDGKPLDRGTIAFEPAVPGKAGAVSVGASISGGSYSIARAEGPTPGSYRVSIRDVTDAPTVSKTEAPGAPPKPKKGAVQGGVPAKYNSQTTLTADVKDSGTPPLNYDLTTK